MLFRPSFCANCGEKIDRSEWRIWTSRRFCQLCEIEYRGHELIPKVVVGLSLAVSVAAIGLSSKNTSEGPDGGKVRQAKSFVERPSDLHGQPETADRASNVRKSSDTSAPTTAAEPVPKTNKNAAYENAKGQLPVGTAPREREPQYFCGAETKKGTPCSRRVKGNVRCFQHVGMPAMVPASQLKIG
jgi:hypothetical protein